MSSTPFFGCGTTGNNVTKDFKIKDDEAVFGAIDAVAEYFMIDEVASNRLLNILDYVVSKDFTPGSRVEPDSIVAEKIARYFNIPNAQANAYVTLIDLLVSIK